MEELTEFSMDDVTNKRWLNALVASCQKGHNMIMASAEGHKASEHDWKIFRIASTLICEMASEEIARQGQLIIGRVLNRNEIKEHFKTMRDVIKIYGANMIGIIENKRFPVQHLAHVARMTLKTLKDIDDMHETGVNYESDSGKKKVYILQNTRIQAFVLEMISAITRERERVETADPDAYRELRLICRRLNKFVGQVSGFDSTPLDHIVPER